MESDKEFKIPLNFSQLIFQLIGEIYKPQTRGEYIYRVKRLDESLSPFMPEDFRAEFDKKMDDFYKRPEVMKMREDRYDGYYNIVVEHAACAVAFTELVKLCELLGIIEFSKKKIDKVIAG